MVSDTESGAAAVTVTATSSSQSLVKDSNVVVSVGSGGNRTITVTPEAGVTGTVTVNYVLSDGSLTTSGSFDVTFTNAAPVISASVSNQAFVRNSAISALTLPSASDSNVSDTVTLTVTGLPVGLSFNSSNRQITGTPTDTAGTYTVTYTATDLSGATDVKTFDIVLSAPPANNAPTISGASSDAIISYDSTLDLDGSGYFIVPPSDRNAQFTVNDSDSGAQLTVTKSVTGPGIVTITNVPGTGYYTSGSPVMFTVSPGTSPTPTQVTFTVSDGVDTRTHTYTVTFFDTGF